MKVYETLGLSRSGHHAVLNWVLKNFCGLQIEWKYKMTAVSNTSVFVLDEANHDIPESFKFLDEFNTKIKLLFVIYEDTPWNYTILNENKSFVGPFSLNIKPEYDIDYLGRFMIIRDFYNTLESRIKANENIMGKEWVSGNPFYFKTDKIFIDRWKNLAIACLENKIPYIKYEDWKKEKNKREEFLEKNFNIKEIFGVENVIGTKSSFDLGDKTSKLTNEIIDMINDDVELKYLIKNLGYEYKNI